MWDWTAAFKGETRVQGFCTSQFGSGMHECYVRKDRDGVVRLWMRKSSRASSWLPEGDGMPVFKESAPPSMPPPIAKRKKDAHWGRISIQATIRAWFPFMAVDSPAEMAEIRSEWDTRFSQLPADEDGTDVQPSQRLVWRALPVLSYSVGEDGATPQVARILGRTALRHLDATAGVTSGLENPPVNPLTGAGRTAADVARDLAAYKAYVRSIEISDCPAVFQADYLLMHPQGPHPPRLLHL